MNTRNTSPTSMNMRLITYNLGQGGSPDPSVWAQVLASLAPDLLFVQESRDPAQSWLQALPGTPDTPNTCHNSWLWAAVPGRRWGSGIWVRDGQLTPLAVSEDFTGWVTATAVEGLAWPGIGVAQALAFSIHAPTRKGSSYIKEMGRILDFIGERAEGRPLILAGDFNVAVGLRQPGQLPIVTRGERALLERLREGFDLIPCWQTAHPGEPLARTLRWLHRSDSPPYHCDGLFVPAAWASTLQNCTVLEGEEWYSLSDHNPVAAVFTFGPL